jgi:hypothetical protein
MRCAHEGFCEDLARQNAVARMSQFQLLFRRCHIWVSVIAVGPKDHCLGRCTVCLGTSAHRPCFDLSIYLQSVCLSLSRLSDRLANLIARASFPRLALPPRR